MAKSEVLFQERQLLARWALIVVVGAGFILPLVAVVRSISSGVPANYWFIGFLGVMLLVMLGMFATMNVVVTASELRVTFGLLRLIRFTFPHEAILSTEVREYQPVKEYGGWGIKGTKQNRALSMRGNQGVQLVIRNRDASERRLLIGSQQPDALANALLRAKSQRSI